ncbi:hypothetical protein ABMA28_001177 [Loxostege sticticalis]|uniref:HTH CENPB-type domain-containing protein n=1 Tax=Loxostege sticticalis TaxID=481309 RepID=A0ABD0T8W0_LOXSC
MVRHYKRKTDKASYSKEKLKDAVRAVRNGDLSGYRAAQIYNIPRMTIMDHVHNKRMKSSTLGRCTALSPEIEKKLASYLHTMERYGFGLSRQEVLEVVGHYVTKNGIPTPFKNGKPGNEWFKAFKERNNLSVKKPQAVEYARKKAVDPFIIYPYFDLLKKTIEDLGLNDKPSAIWNLDETSFSKDPSKTKIVGRKGHASTRLIASPGKDNTTVLLAANAVGEKLPPLIIFKGKNVWDSWTSPDAYPNTTYAATTNGWMESEVFENFFKKSFIPALGKQRPILLIYDGHSTHVGLNIIEEANKENVTILKLPAHTSHVLQPLDLAVMKSFKDRWDPLLVKWQRLNIGVPLPKSEFSRLIGTVWTQIDPVVLRNGFQKAGIYPLNQDVVQEHQFDSLKLKKWKESSLNSNVPIIDEHEMAFTGCHLSEQNPRSLLSIVLDFINKKMYSKSSTCTMTDENNHSYKDHHDTSTSHLSANSAISFEELLLSKVKKGDTTKVTRRKVAPGAEVITHTDVILRKRSETKNSKSNNNSHTSKLQSIPSTSACNVTSLSQTRSRSQARPFTMKTPDDIPDCLKEKRKDKIQILSNILISKSTETNFKNKALVKPGTSGTNLANPSIRKMSSTSTFQPSSTKGKGIGKKSSGKENKPCTNTASLIDVKPFELHRKKHNVPSSHSSTTSVSGSISSHSDSDILDAVSDEESDHAYETEKKADTKTHLFYKEIEKQKNPPRSKPKELSCESDEDESRGGVPVLNLRSRRGDATRPNLRPPMPMYNIGDHVLVRYDTKTKWTYYVGIIENIISQNKNLIYCTKFYKTIKKPKLIFKWTKRIDRDEVPESLIVKKVEIVPTSSKSNDFLLSNQDDAVFFI